MKATRIHHRLARHASSLLLLLALTVATVQGAWGQDRVEGNRYTTENGSANYTPLQLERPGHSSLFNYASRMTDGDETTYAYAEQNSQGLPYDTYTLSNAELGRIQIVSTQRQRRPTNIRISISDNENSGFEKVGEYDLIYNDNVATVTLSEPVSAPYVRLTFLRRASFGYSSLLINELYFFAAESNDPVIRHKDPKWFDLREQLNLPVRSLGTFSYDRPRFDPISSSATDSIQAAHTYIDTIYMHKGKSIDLALPTKSQSGNGGTSSVQTYQRWYSYRTRVGLANSHQRDCL